MGVGVERGGQEKYRGRVPQRQTLKYKGGGGDQKDNPPTHPTNIMEKGDSIPRGGGWGRSHLIRCYDHSDWTRGPVGVNDISNVHIC